MGNICQIPLNNGVYTTEFSQILPDNCPEGVGTTRFLVNEYDQEEKDYINAIKLDDYNTAQNILNGFSQSNQDKVYFKQVQQINLNRLINGPNYILNPTNSLILENIGNANTPINAYARSVLMFLKNRRLDIQIPSVPSPVPELLEDQSALDNVLIRPNPTTSIVHIQFPKSMDTMNCKVQLFDNSGRLLFERKIERRSGYEEEIDLSGLNSGLYYLSIIQNDTLAVSEKIILQK